MNLQKKTIVITGASSGIGAAVAQRFVAEGARVYGFDLKAPRTKIDGVQYVKCDVTKSVSVKKALRKVRGPIHVLINNAGIMRRGEMLASSEEDFDKLFAVHLKGAWLMVKFARRKLVKGAKILQMSSRHALYFPSDPGLYALAKRAVLDFSEMLSQTHPEWTVKTLCPGPVDTPLSRNGCNGKDWKKKKKMACTPEYLSDQVVALLDSKKEKLVFDQDKCTYYFE